MSRVLHLIDSAGLYGAERVILALLEALRGTDYPGVLGCIRDDRAAVSAVAEEAGRRGIDVAEILVRSGLRPSGFGALRRAVAETGAGIVHTHGYKPDFLAGAQPSRRFPVVATVHGWAKSSGGWKNRSYEALDAWALRRVDRVVAVSEGVKRDLKVRGVAANVSVIHTGIATT